jgi:hypothetical protein
MKTNRKEKKHGCEWMQRSSEKKEPGLFVGIQ